MTIIDKPFDPSTAFQILDFPLATSQNQLDSQRAKIDPEWAAYRETVQFWIDKGLELSAVAYHGDADVRFDAYFATREEADAFAAQFPKSAKIRTGGMSGGYGGERWEAAAVHGQWRFQTNGVTGEKNETSIKRFANFLKIAEKLGLEINWVYNAGNAISFDELTAHNA